MVLVYWNPPGILATLFPPLVMAGNVPTFSNEHSIVDGFDGCMVLGMLTQHNHFKNFLSTPLVIFVALAKHVFNRGNNIPVPCFRHVMNQDFKLHLFVVIFDNSLVATSDEMFSNRVRTDGLTVETILDSKTVD